MPGTLTHPVGKIIRQWLIDQSIGVDGEASPSADWSTFYETEPPVPEKVITVQDTEGRRGGRVMTDGEVQMHHGIQVRVRADDKDECFTKAQAVADAIDALLRATVTVSSTDYLIQSISRVGDVLGLGKNLPSTKRSVYVINALVSLRQTT